MNIGLNLAAMLHCISRAPFSQAVWVTDKTRGFLLSVLLPLLCAIVCLFYNSAVLAKNWQLGVEGIYTHFNDSAFLYAKEYSGAVENAQQFSGQPENHVDFRVFAHYYFTSNFDVAAAWTRLHSSQNSHLSASEAIYEMPVVGYPAGAIRLLDEVHNDARLKFDSVHVSLGRTKQWQRVSVRGSFGLEYARINTRQYTVGEHSLLPPEFPSAMSVTQNQVYGIGPRFGLDTRVNLLEQLDLLAAVAISALLSEKNWQQSASDLLGGEFSSRCSSAFWMPAVSLRAGAEYRILPGSMDITLTGGYQFQEYYNSLYTTELKQTNFRQHGPYFGIFFRA